MSYTQLSASTLQKGNKRCIFLYPVVWLSWRHPCVCVCVSARACWALQSAVLLTHRLTHAWQPLSCWHWCCVCTPLSDNTPPPSPGPTPAPRWQHCCHHTLNTTHLYTTYTLTPFLWCVPQWKHTQYSHSIIHTHSILTSNHIHTLNTHTQSYTLNTHIQSYTHTQYSHPIIHSHTKSQFSITVSGSRNESLPKSQE